jgi:hypothetical protein
MNTTVIFKAQADVIKLFGIITLGCTELWTTLFTSILKNYSQVKVINPEILP